MFASLSAPAEILQHTGDIGDIVTAWALATRPMVTASSQVTRFLISMVFSEQIPDTKQSSRSLKIRFVYTQMSLNS